ncbi:MAG: SanA protein, partial [Thermoflexus sp.]
SSPYYDETEAMRRLALRLGVPLQALQIDPGGLRTLDSCRRAREIFGATAVVVITQRFHLPRALWLCEAAGLEAVGLWWTAREIPASLTALAEGLLLRLGRRDSR